MRMYNINLLLTLESKSALGRMKGRMINRVTRDNFGGWSILVRLDDGNKYIFIRNDVDAHPEYKNEYTQFVVSENCSLGFGKTITHSINKVVNDIYLVTDYVTWEHSEGVWDIQADIGILFALDGGEEILIEAVDSLAGFMRYYQGCDCLKQMRSVAEQWRTKTDELRKARREIRNL